MSELLCPCVALHSITLLHLHGHILAWAHPDIRWSVVSSSCLHSLHLLFLLSNFMFEKSFANFLVLSCHSCLLSLSILLLIYTLLFLYAVTSSKSLFLPQTEVLWLLYFLRPSFPKRFGVFLNILFRKHQVSLFSYVLILWTSACTFLLQDLCELCYFFGICHSIFFKKILPFFSLPFSESVTVLTSTDIYFIQLLNCFSKVFLLQLLHFFALLLFCFVLGHFVVAFHSYFTICIFPCLKSDNFLYLINLSSCYSFLL